MQQTTVFMTAQLTKLKFSLGQKQSQVATEEEIVEKFSPQDNKRVDTPVRSRPAGSVTRARPGGPWSQWKGSPTWAH